MGIYCSGLFLILKKPVTKKRLKCFIGLGNIAAAIGVIHFWHRQTMSELLPPTTLLLVNFCQVLLSDLSFWPYFLQKRPILAKKY